ncbi:MAG: hypothetical protein JNK56_04425, partial [Myxococcales bacterium]|nr:hypothetical protein [Myxococcales bacterium]
THPINADETGLLTEENVFTNTLPDGSSASDLHCAGWTSKDNSTTTIGQSSAVDNVWTQIMAPGICSGVNRLYCFQDL